MEVDKLKALLAASAYLQVRPPARMRTRRLAGRRQDSGCDWFELGEARAQRPAKLWADRGLQLDF
jgi:hypothetical protein